MKIGQCATTKFDGWIICSNVDAKYFQSKVDAILYKQLLISFIFIIIAAFAVWILAKRLLQPTQSIESGLKDFFDFLNHKNDNPKAISLKS
ncbi:methyl-accepting chemotaxis protein, partial [Campylobacter fetus]|nr:methyl-accepting chemotaxis protein [Campylobacter fetus]